MALETERLRLRGWRDSDIDAYAAMVADPEVGRFLGGPMDSVTGAWRHLAFMVGHWELRGYGIFAVERKEDGELIGRVGFINPAGWPGFELGWTLARPHWGQGYATEAALSCLRFAFEELKRDRVISLIPHGHERSLALARRIGERPAGETQVKGTPVTIYARDRTDWP